MKKILDALKKMPKIIYGIIAALVTFIVVMLVMLFSPLNGDNNNSSGPSSSYTQNVNHSGNEKKKEKEENKTNKKDNNKDDNKKAEDKKTGEEKVVKEEKNIETTTNVENTNTSNTETTNNSSQTSQETSMPAQKEKKPIYNKVYHEPTGHYETQVISEAYDDPQFEERVVGIQSGHIYDSAVDFARNGDLYGDDNYALRQVQVGSVHHDAVTTQVWVEDSPGYYEDVIVGWE